MIIIAHHDHSSGELIIMIKKQPDTPSIGKVPDQRDEVVESTRHKSIKFHVPIGPLRAGLSKHGCVFLCKLCSCKGHNRLRKDVLVVPES